MAESVSSGFLVGLIVYQAVITVGVIGYLIYLSLSFSNYRTLVAKAFAELLKQDEELARRIQQVVSSFTLMDALFPSSTSTTVAPKSPPKKKENLRPLHDFSKDKSKETKERGHLSVITPKEEPGSDKGD
jgi:hypothetical protein